VLPSWVTEVVLPARVPDADGHPKPPPLVVGILPETVCEVTTRRFASDPAASVFLPIIGLACVLLARQKKLNCSTTNDDPIVCCVTLVIAGSTPPKETYWTCQGRVSGLPSAAVRVHASPFVHGC